MKFLKGMGIFLGGFDFDCLVDRGQSLMKRFSFSAKNSFV